MLQIWAAIWTHLKVILHNVGVNLSRCISKDVYGIARKRQGFARKAGIPCPVDGAQDDWRIVEELDEC